MYITAITLFFFFFFFFNYAEFLSENLPKDFQSLIPSCFLHVINIKGGASFTEIC